MALLRKIAHGLRALFHKQQLEHDLDEELNGFIEAAAEQKIRSGINREEAMRAARIQVGSTAAVARRATKVDPLVALREE